MKITCIIHSLNGGGAERVMAGLCCRLSGRGHRVTLVTLDDGKLDRHPLAPEIERVTLDLMGESRNLWQKLRSNRARIKAIARELQQQRPDVVLSFCDRTNITVLLAAKNLDLPVVVCERSDPAKQKLGFVWETARRRSYPTASRIIALTESAANHLQPLSSQEIVVIPSAVDQPPEFSNRDQAIAAKCVLGMGRLEREKGFDRLIEAFHLATAQHSDWSLRILGEGSLREELQEMAAELDMGDRLTLPGWVNPVWSELSSASVFALPSRYEGFPSALLEAMACGVPSVAVDCESGPREIIRHQRNGLLVRNSVDELAEGIRRLIEDDPLRERIGECGKEIVEQFGWDQMVDQYETTLKEVAGSTEL